ncbi:LOW QUALITY PROTEIN: hypothetical protein HID58_049077 [Brassica napus]|uniref:ATPase AAA-type core domain-containing protein n=1 Tax=Brassica napus TaxID=3708 RepID=A0ABQ8B3Y3_BRANA|nr:LOW QUALITY PROTEIN: hypothetical protein HID58_049077 [Brassica napus]
MRSSFIYTTLHLCLLYSSQYLDIPSFGSTVLALSGLLCSLVLGTPWGEARIIVIFTTNNKDMLDPTLLSRISVDIYMVHCCFEGFKVLASNYWGLSHVNDDEPHPHRLSRHQAFD